MFFPVSINPISSGQKAALLTNETEVSVAPKTKSKSKVRHSEINGTGEANNTIKGAEEAPEKIYSTVNRVLPPKNFELPPSEESLAWVSPVTFFHLFPTAIERPITSTPCGYATYERLPSPAEPSDSAAPSQSAPAAPLEPILIHSGSHSATNANTPEDAVHEENKTLFICSTAVLPMCIVLNKPPYNLDYDLIRYDL